MPQMKTIQFPGSDDVYEVVDEGARESVKAQQEALDNKLDANKLPDAVDDALAKAKASGEFKGDDGAPGEPGDPGVYYGSEAPTDDSVNVWIDPDGEPSGYEEWEFTLTDGTTVKKRVVLV